MLRQTTQQLITALYPRLSHEDELSGEMCIRDSCKRTDDTYPFSSLAGVGVAFKLICALEGDTLSVLDRYADLVALGTVADVMPIVGENRIIVAEGLKKLSVTANIGLEMLLREAGMKNRRLTSSTISYVLAPRINAAGRMGKAELAAELFLTKDPVRAQALAAELCEQNKLRQSEENKILEQTLTRLRREYNPLEDKIIVLAGEGWHQGVIGIVCSRLCDRYGCPVVLISVDEDGVGKGSGRSIGSFNLFEALTSCEDLFERYGGHALAAGLTVQADRIEELRTRLRRYAETHVTMAELVPQLHIDCMVQPEWLTQENICLLYTSRRELFARAVAACAGKCAVHAHRLFPEGFSAYRGREPCDAPAGARHVSRRPRPQGKSGRKRLPPAERV